MTEQSLDGWHRNALRRAAGAACAAALLIGTAAGCSAGGTPTPGPLEPDTSAASTTPSETPSASAAPTLPPEAKGTSDKAAIAFVEHWVALFNHSTSSLSTPLLSRASDPACTPCNAMIDSIK